MLNGIKRIHFGWFRAYMAGHMQAKGGDGYMAIDPPLEYKLNN
jgi:hypothetical protein